MTVKSDEQTPKNNTSVKTSFTSTMEKSGGRQLRLLAIFREPRFSFNAVEVDRAILIEAAKALKKVLKTESQQNLEVEFVEAEHLATSYKNKKLPHADLVISMAQSHEVLKLLQTWERSGIRVVNSTASVLSCYRNRMHQILKRGRFGYPKSGLIDLSLNASATQLREQLFSTKNGYWIKRGDFHALQADDVVYANNKESALHILNGFMERGITAAVVQEHMLGDVYKVYGVPGLFFHLRWVSSTNVKRHEISEERVAECVMGAARAMDLEVFGADCVVSEDGEVHVIDMNDWPSFRVCREEAARGISRYLMGILNEVSGMPPQLSAESMATALSQGLKKTSAKVC